MGERGSAGGDGNDDPPLKPTSDVELPPGLKPPPAGVTVVKSIETYVIQIPRDQVYRIPPPQNADIVDSCRKPCNDGKCSWGGRWIFILLAIILIVFGVFLIINTFSDPKFPEFSITRFNKRNIKSSPKHHSAIKISQYEVSLAVYNPNDKYNVRYGAGNVTLSLKGHEIGNGGFKSVQQDGGSAINVEQSLNGTKEALLPKWVEKSMNDKHPKVLILRIDVPIEVKTWKKTIKKDLIVGCHLEVNSLTEGAKVLSQKCGTHF